MSRPTVIEALRRFLPAYLSSKPPLSAEQRRAIWALQACRTSELGGHVHACTRCAGAPLQFAYHSCHHKACPQCGRRATRQWVQRQEQKRINAPQLIRSPPPAPSPLRFAPGLLLRRSLSRG